MPMTPPLFGPVLKPAKSKRAGKRNRSQLGGMPLSAQPVERLSGPKRNVFEPPGRWGGRLLPYHGVWRVGERFQSFFV